MMFIAQTCTPMALQALDILDHLVHDKPFSTSTKSPN